MATVKLDPAKGIQIPNLTTTERNAISSPETGAIIWNTTTSEINQYNGSAWEITYTDTNTQIAGITSAADATAITIGSDEKVGIGTSSPARLLTVYGDTGIALQNSTTGTGTGNGTHIWVNSEGSGELLIQNRENSDIEFLTNDTERMRILASGGLTFNGDTAAANALDDYEEGTWTPTLATGTLSGAYGNYIKIGKMCYISFHLSNFSNKSSTANVTIRGIPFTIGGTFNIGTVVAYQNGNSNPLNLVTGTATTEFHMYQMYNASSWSLQKHNTLGGDPNFYCYGGYQTT